MWRLIHGAMSCGCENRERMKRLEKVRELATKTARLTGEAQVIIQHTDGTYHFKPLSEANGEKITEYIII